MSGGLFTTTIDFGAGVFTGGSNWLEIAARTNGGGSFTTLAPRQQLTPVPYAISANTTSNLLGALPATQLVGSLALAQLPPAVVTNGTTGVTLTGTFSGNGAGLTDLPSSGGGFAWQVVTGTSRQAQPNTGYLANNAAQVTITLPTAPNIGDIVHVSGVGLGGWIIAQNAAQSVLVGSLPRSTIPVYWTAQNSGYHDWGCIASSADGTKLVAGENPGQLYTSANSGVTWTAQTSGSLNWYSVASSADGTKLVASAGTGGIYTSANSGVTWTNTAPNMECISVASSAEGIKLVAGGLGIYTSTDSGVTWTPTSAPATNGYSVASSADGTKLVAAGKLIDVRII